MAYRSFRVFFRGFLWHIPNCIMLYINTLKHVAISRQTSSKLLNHRNKLIFTVVTAILAPEMTNTPRFFAHESHEFSCKRAQNRTCSSFAERSRKCQEIYTNLFVLCIKGDLYGRTNHTNSMILFEMLLRQALHSLREIRAIRATEQVAIKKHSTRFVQISLTFSAALGITRTSSVLHSLARKFVQFVGKN